MEIDRRLFCKLILFSSASLLAGCFRSPVPHFFLTETSRDDVNGYPGEVFPLDRDALRRTGKWAG
jgi:hypothetical protein